MKIQDNNGQFRVTLPRGIALLKGLHQGKKITVVLNENNEIVIKDIPSTLPSKSNSKKQKTRRVQNNAGQFRLTIPKDIALAKKWRQGTQIVAILRENGDIILKELNEKTTKN